MGEFWGHVRTKIGVGFGQKIPFSEIGPPGFTPPGFGRTLFYIYRNGAIDSLRATLKIIFLLLLGWWC